MSAKPDAAGGGSGTIDAAPDAPSVGEATVEVRLNGAATGGVKVDFQEADGSVASEAVTDTSGKATGTVHANAMVTVAVGPKDLVTITGVNPGEQILLKTRPPYDSSTAGTVSFGTAGEAANKSYYRADVGDDEYVTVQTMASGTRSVSLLRGNLDGNGKFSMAAGTYDVNNRMISYTFVTALSPVIGGTSNVTLPAFRTDLLDYNVMMSGAPAAATQLTVNTANEVAGMLFLPSSFANNSKKVAITGGNASANIQYPGGFGDFIRTTLDVSFGTPRESMTLTRRAARPAGLFTVGANDFPARIGIPAVDSATAGRPKVSWTVTGNTTNGDGTLVTLGWNDANAVAHTWNVYVAPDATSVTFPTLSSAIAAQGPVQGSTFKSVSVTQHNLEPLAGWAAFHVAPPIDYSNTYDMPPGFASWSLATNSASL